MWSSALNQSDNSVHNRTLVLKLIKQKKGITRKELTEISGLTKPAISKIVNLFIDNGIITERESDGKRNKDLVFAEKTYYIIAINLSRLKVNGCIFDLSGKVVATCEIDEGITDLKNDQIPYRTGELIESIIQKSKVDKKNILAVGISAPGVVDSSNVITYSNAIEYNKNQNHYPFNWQAVDLTSYIEKNIGLQVMVENNSNLSALAENWFGKGVGARNLVQFSIGIGIGGGAIINGHLYVGGNKRACEIGHTSVIFEGEKCYCGNRGCVEAEAGLPKIVEKYSPNKEFNDYDAVISEFETILNNAVKGEKRAVDLILRSAHMMGSAAVNFINLFSPEMFVISTNDVSHLSLKPMMVEISKYIRNYAYPTVSDKIDIAFSELGEEIHLLGSYALIFENIYYFLSKKIDFS